MWSFLIQYSSEIVNIVGSSNTAIPSTKLFPSLLIGNSKNILKLGLEWNQSLCQQILIWTIAPLSKNYFISFSAIAGTFWSAIELIENMPTWAVRLTCFWINDKIDRWLELMPQTNVNIEKLRNAEIKLSKWLKQIIQLSTTDQIISA